MPRVLCIHPHNTFEAVILLFSPRLKLLELSFASNKVTMSDSMSARKSPRARVRSLMRRQGAQGNLRADPGATKHRPSQMDPEGPSVLLSLRVAEPTERRRLGSCVPCPPTAHISSTRTPNLPFRLLVAPHTRRGSRCVFISCSECRDEQLARA